jgi:signal transduction histidine kinase/DNA-binding response OmpR family regulator
MVADSAGNTPSDALARRLRGIHRKAVIAAFLWLAVLIAAYAWYAEHTASRDFSLAASTSQQVAASTAIAIDKSFRELDVLSKVLAQQNDLRNTLSRHARDGATFAALPAEARIERLKADGAVLAAGEALAALCDSIGYDLIYVLDQHGITIASSDTQERLSLIGLSFADRPYFQGALAKGAGRAFLVGRVNQIPGFYVATRMNAADGATGVLVIRQPARTFAPFLSSMRHLVLVTDRNGVVAASSDKALILHHAGPLTPARPSETALRDTYSAATLPALDLTPAPTPRGAGHWLLAGQPYLASTTALAEPDYQVTVLTPLDTLASGARRLRYAAALLALIGIALIIALHEIAVGIAHKKDARVRLEHLNQQLQHEKHLAEQEARRARVAEAEIRVQDKLLAASREQAVEAVRIKAAFLATMSHEIRTPLNGVVGMTALLADTALTDEQHDYLRTMRVSSDQLLNVVNDILDFSKIESGKLELESEIINLRWALEESCEIAAPRAREKALDIVTDVDDDVPQWVRGDITRLRQLLLNLISNAVKFTDHGQVAVSAHVKAADQPQGATLIEFRVKDSGIGIPPERQGELFQSFTQVDSSITRKYGGTGLGLAICKRLAELMGGEVGLSSEPGRGSLFWFTALLPAAEAPEGAPVLVDNLPLTSLNGISALVVDDTLLNAQIVHKQLTRWGMRAVFFERSEAALDWLVEHRAALLITDMHMPGMNGVEFANIVRARWPATKIVLMTSASMPTGESARVFDARLLKPYRQALLLDTLRRVMGGGEANPRVAERRRQPRLQRILVVDDNALNLTVARAMAGKLGYDVTVAGNGLEAINLVAKSLTTAGRPFSAVLMDCSMPVIDGYEATRKILATHADAAPPIIALTASVADDDRRRCAEAGMRGFLTKPLRTDELAEALSTYAVDTTVSGAATGANPL